MGQEKKSLQELVDEAKEKMGTTLPEFYTYNRKWYSDMIEQIQSLPQSESRDKMLRKLNAELPKWSVAKEKREMDKINSDREKWLAGLDQVLRDLSAPIDEDYLM